MKRCTNCDTLTSDITGDVCWHCEQAEIDAVEYGVMTRGEFMGEAFAVDAPDMDVYGGMYSEM